MNGVEQLLHTERLMSALKENGHFSPQRRNAIKRRILGGDVREYGRLNLAAMDMSDEMVNALCDVVVQVQWPLRELSIRMMRLVHIPDGISCLTGVPTLESLDLPYNRVSDLPEWVFSLHNLKRLDLYENCLTQLPDLFDRLPHLTEIYLGDNRLGSLPSTLFRLRGLKLHAGENWPPHWVAELFENGVDVILPPTR